LLKRGDVFKGSLLLQAKGNSGSPVVVSSWQGSDTSKPRPVIDAEGCLAGIQMNNAENVEISGIKIRSEAKDSSDYTHDVTILNNRLKDIGGPGIQPGKCINVMVKGNVVDHSGSLSDSRMHGRGSGIWPWYCRDVLIEHNKFMYAHGKMDSHEAYIDHHCFNVIIQYNMSIEVFFKEAKQYFGLGKLQSQDFDTQIADISIAIIQYNVFSLAKKIEAYETLGGLFKEIKEQVIEYTIS